MTGCSTPDCGREVDTYAAHGKCCLTCGNTSYPDEHLATCRRKHQETFWNGEPTPARRVRVIVGEPPTDMPAHWLHGSGLIGKPAYAVEVTYPARDAPMYLYDDDGLGWLKVTQGRGSPWWGHKNLPVERVLDDSPGGTPRQPPPRRPARASANRRLDARCNCDAIDGDHSQTCAIYIQRSANDDVSDLGSSA